VRQTSQKRYKYVGKERDEETGLYYYGFRYYAAWLCRFVSVDPLAGKFPFYTPYQYTGNNPVTFTDLDGRETTDNDTTGSSVNGQQNNYSQTTHTPITDANGTTTGLTTETNSAIKNEDGSYTLSHKWSTWYFNEEGNGEEFSSGEGSLTVNSTDLLDQKWKDIINGLNKNIGAENNLNPQSLGFPEATSNNKVVNKKGSDSVSDAINLTGALVGIGEYSSPATWGMYENSKGIKVEIESLKGSKGVKYTSQGVVDEFGKTKHLSKHAKKAISKSKFFKGLGKLAGWGGIVYSAYNVVTNDFKGWEKASVDTGFALLGMYGGPIGFGISSAYFLADYLVNSYYPGGWKGVGEDMVNSIMTIHNLHTRNGVMMNPSLFGK